MERMIYLAIVLIIFTLVGATNCADITRFNFKGKSCNVATFNITVGRYDY